MIHLAYLVSLTILVRIAASAQWAVVDCGKRLVKICHILKVSLVEVQDG
jgi:hypothetical protein